MELWTRLWSSLVCVSWVLEKNVHSVVRWSVLLMLIRSCWLMLCLNFSVSLLLILFSFKIKFDIFLVFDMMHDFSLKHRYFGEYKILDFI